MPRRELVVLPSATVLGVKTEALVNAVEQIVSCYFQMVRRCLTASDVKVIRGNGRQFDLLAQHLPSRDQYHVEASVTHLLNSCPTAAQLEESFRQKFFGVPKPKDGDNTDHARGKSYLTQVDETYRQYGFSFQTLRRVWCCWAIRGAEQSTVVERMKGVAEEYGVKDPRCEVLLLRDEVIPELTDAVGSSNYDDDVLRIISLLKQQRSQAETEPKTRRRRSTASGS